MFETSVNEIEELVIYSEWFESVDGVEKSGNRFIVIEAIVEDNRVVEEINRREVPEGHPEYEKYVDSWGVY